jgi:hypothetical protein
MVVGCILKPFFDILNFLVDVFFTHNSIRWQKLKCCVVRKVVLSENCVESDLILGVQILRNDCFDYVSSPSAQLCVKSVVAPGAKVVWDTLHQQFWLNQKLWLPHNKPSLHWPFFLLLMMARMLTL